MSKKRSGKRQQTPQEPPQDAPDTPDAAEPVGVHELTDEPQAQQADATPEPVAEAHESGGANAEAKLDTLRNAIEGCQLLINHLRATGTGQSKLSNAEAHIKSIADRLGGSDIKPVSRDIEAMRRGALDMVAAMTVGDEGTVPPAWMQPTADKARTFINSAAFK